MIRLDEDALICDLAETYQIFDYRRVPVPLLGTLAAGLGPDARIRQKASGVTAGQNTILLAQIFDVVNLLLWTKTKDAERGRNRPKLVSDKYFINENEDDYAAMTIDEFRSWHKAHFEEL